MLYNVESIVGTDLNDFVDTNRARLTDANGQPVRVTLDGRGGADTIWAGASDNIVKGGAGADILHGEAGTDILSYDTDTQNAVHDENLKDADQPAGANGNSHGFGVAVTFNTAAQFSFASTAATPSSVAGTKGTDRYIILKEDGTLEAVASLSTTNPENYAVIAVLREDGTIAHQMKMRYSEKGTRQLREQAFFNTPDTAGATVTYTLNALVAAQLIAGFSFDGRGDTFTTMEIIHGSQNSDVLVSLGDTVALRSRRGGYPAGQCR